MPVTVREATLEDAEAIAHIHVAMWQHAYRGQMPDALLDGISLERRLTWRVQMLSAPAPKAHTFVAVEGETILGFCDVGASREEGAGDSAGELYAIYVAPGTEGKGIGSALMAAGIEALCAEGFTHATLWVLASNVPTIEFYERKGWAADGMTKTEMWNDVPLHELRYARSLRR